jgi:hypothetical protein
LIGFNQSKEGLVNAFRVYQNHINEALKAIKQETDQKGALEKQAEKLMKELIQHKQEKDQCLVGFIKLLESERGVSIEELFQKDIQEIQEFADLFLGHYLTHSQERFPKLFKTHQDFAERVAEMFILLEKQILPGDLQELKLLLTDFLNRHIKLEDKKAKESSETETVSNTAKKSNAEPAKPLYRKVQAAHEADSDLLNECNMISEKLQKVLPWLFGKGFAVSPEAAHLVPYPGVVSWDLNYLSQLFKQRLGVTLNLEADRLALFNQNVKPFAETVQAGEKIDPETVKMELKTRLSLDSNITRDENFTFIFNTLVFLTHLSSLEMADTRHLPEYFNQVVDKYSETEIKYENSQGRGYKVLLGEALIDLINSPDSSQLSEKHITYLKSTLEAVSGRLKELADKKEATYKLTSLELVECHALYSIYLAVKTITEEKNLDQSILEKEKLIEASAEKITA